MFKSIIIVIRGSQLWRDSFENLPLGWLLMSLLNFLSTRSYKTRPGLSSSAMSYEGIVYLEYSEASLATHQAGKHLVCQPVQPLADKIRQDLLSGCIRIGPLCCLIHTVNLHIKFSSLDINIQVSQLNTLQVSFIVQDAAPSGGGKKKLYLGKFT